MNFCMTELPCLTKCQHTSTPSYWHECRTRAHSCSSRMTALGAVVPRTCGSRSQDHSQQRHELGHVLPEQPELQVPVPGRGQRCAKGGAKPAQVPIARNWRHKRCSDFGSTVRRLYKVVLTNVCKGYFLRLCSLTTCHAGFRVTLGVAPAQALPLKRNARRCAADTACGNEHFDSRCRQITSKPPCDLCVSPGLRLLLHCR